MEGFPVNYFRVRTGKAGLALLLFGFMMLGSLRLKVLSVNGDNTDFIEWLGTGDNYE